MNLVRQLLKNRINNTLVELDELADKITDRAVDASESLSPVKIANAGVLPPKDIREYSRIQNRLSVLMMIDKSLFNGSGDE